MPRSISKGAREALRFAQSHPDRWHSYAKDARRFVRELAEAGLVTVSESTTQFRWDRSTYSPRPCSRCGELESASPAWAGCHRYGPVRHPFTYGKEAPSKD